MSSKAARIARALGKFLTRLVVATALVASVAGAALYFIPFRFNALEARARTAFRAATGLELRFEALLFYLAQRRVVLRGVQILDLDTGETLAGARRLEVESDWRWGDSSSIRQIHALRIEEPTALSFSVSSQGLRPSPSLARLVEAGSRRADPGGADGWRIDSLSLRGGAFNVSQGPGGKPVAQIEDATLMGSWSGPADFEFLAHGKIKAGKKADSTTWRGRFSSLADGPGLRFFTNVSELSGEKQFLIEFPLAASGSNVSLGGEIRPDPRTRNGARMDLDLAADRLDLLNTRTNRALRTTDLRLSARALYEPSSSTLRLEMAEAQALDFRLAGDGWIGLRDPYEYDLRLDQIEAPEQALRRLQDFAPEIRRIVSYEGGSLSGAGKARGFLTQPRPESLEAWATLSNVQLDVPALALPLRDVTGTLRCDGQSLHSDDLSGSFGHSRVELSMALEAEQPYGVFEGRPRRLRLEWKMDGQSDDLMALLAQDEAGAIGGLKTSGSVVSSGALTADFGATPTLEAAAKSLHVSGQAHLAKFRVEHPGLPAVIEDGSGFLDVENTALRCRDLKGKALGSTVSVTGSVKGSPYFWTNPKADLRISSDVDVGRLAPVLQERIGEKASLPPLSGRADMEIHLVGELKRPKTISYTGDLRLHDLAAEFDTDGLRGRIEKATGGISLGADRVGFKDLKFRIGQANYAFTGELTRADLKGDLRLAGPLNTIKGAHPIVFEYFDVDGSIDVAAKMHLGLSAPERAVALADKRSPPFMAFADGVKALSARSFDGFETFGRLVQSLDGQALTKDVEMTYLTFPARVAGATGTVLLTKEGFRAERLDLLLGGYPAVAKGEYFFNREGHRGMDYVLTAKKMDMTPWYGRWREPPPEFAYQPLAPGKKPFIKATTHAVVHVDEATQGQYKFRNHDAEFLFINWKGPNNILYIAGLTAETCQGKGFTKGTITFPRDEEMFWGMEIEVMGLEIQDVIKEVFGKEGGVSGKLDADFTLGAVATEAKTFQGQGRLEIHQPHFSNSTWMAKLRETTGLQFLADTIFPTLEGDFAIQDGCVRSERMSMGSEVIELVGRGQVGFDTQMDLDVYAKPLGVIDAVPLVGPTLGLISPALLKLRVTGKASNPLIVPSPLSADKLLDLPFLLAGKKNGAASQPQNSAAKPSPTPLPLGPRAKLNSAAR